MTNLPFVEEIKKWRDSEEGMVTASNKAWKGAQFAKEWLSALSGSVFELGPGGGRQTSVLVEKCQVDVADISKEILLMLKQEIPEIGKLFWIEKSGDPFPVPDDSYDAFVANYIFCHCSLLDMWKYMGEAVRIVKPGGLIYFDLKIIDETNWNEFVKWHLAPGHQHAHGVGIFHIRALSPDMLSGMARSLGFKIERTIKYHKCIMEFEAKVI